MSNPRYVTTGTANANPIQVDVTSLGSAVPVSVTLTADYTLANPRPPGYPTQPGLTGVAYSEMKFPGRVIPSGTTLKLLQPEADALIAAGVATAA